MKLSDLHEELDDEKDDPHGSFLASDSGHIKIVRLAMIKGEYKLPPAWASEDVASYDAGNMGLMNLKGTPRKVEKTAWFSANYLKNLNGDLHEVGLLHVDRNELETLDGDVRIADTIFASKNKLKNLKGIHKVFKQLKHLVVDHNPLKSHLLGVLLVPGLEDVVFNMDGFQEDPLYKAEKIINSFLPNTRGMEAVLDCQEVLIDAGLEDFAQV